MCISKPSVFVFVLLLSSSLFFGCEGGVADPPNMDQYKTPNSPNPEDPNPMPQAGGMLMEDPVGGTPMGGTPMGGTPMGGTPMGGTPMDVVDPNNCGLEHDESLTTFQSAVLPVILTNCTATCHSSTGTRTYKYSFDAATVDELDNEQIQEALEKTSEYITIGDGAGSSISTLLLYDHPTLNIVQTQPPYSTIIEWIDGMPVCP